MLLSKGFEIEIYTGTPQGEIVGLSDRIVKDLEGFIREPDSRNVEYTTAPLCDYDRLLCALIKPRQRLRSYLHKLGDYTLIPGSTLALGDSDTFFRSDPYNPYHTFIEKSYGTKVVTASVHINIGISSAELLMKACRLVRVEAPLYLAMSACSPFLGGKITGYHSTRWGLFPKTPAFVPLFASHQHHIDWVEAQLKLKTMQNVRHLWSSVRPNGDHRPHDLNRLELRICDLMTNPIGLLAVTALLEARLHQMLENPDKDPLEQSKFSPEELISLTDENEAKAAVNSLDAELIHWQDGRRIKASDWIAQLYEEVFSFAKTHGFSCFLLPVKKILREGNLSQQWLKQCAAGLSVTEVMQQAIKDLEFQELELAEKIGETSLICR